MDKHKLLDLLVIVTRVVAEPIYTESGFGDLDCVFCSSAEHEPHAKNCDWQQLRTAYLRFCAPQIANIESETRMKDSEQN